MAGGADDPSSALFDLFDEAPIAYVHEDLQSRFIRANRAALRLLGLAPDDVEGMVGMSLVPDTPDAQRRVKEAFEAIQGGADTSGIILELRRKNDGQPIFVQWYSRPAPGGAFTRTMFIDVTDKVLLEREQERLRAQNRYLRDEIKGGHNFDEIVGGTQGLRGVLDAVGRVATTDSTVLITGETGTGKELIARAIHDRSRRHDRALITLNCAALPAGLVESELFGHERGAFSGAVSQRLGRFELAHGGTIFLDEIGEMALDTQAKVLRVLQEQQLERVGGQTPVRVDVRVIAATNRDLRKEVKDGRFREDLYYRLAVFPIKIPPLRERSDDIEPLVTHFMATLSGRVGRRVEAVEPATLERLRRYAWPGNVRELQNMIERAIILATTSELRIGPEAFPPASDAPTGGRDLESVERDHIIEALHAASWVIEGERGAARQLGLHPNTLRSRMKKLGIQRARAR